jgi:tetratricopeptide (TPR) repeat protein
MVEIRKQYEKLKKTFEASSQESDFVKGLQELITLAGVEKSDVWKMFFLGRLADGEGKDDEALKLYSKLSEMAHKTDDIEELIPISWALVNKGVAFAKQENWQDAILTYDDLVRRFGDAEEIQLREQVAGALINKGATLGEQKKWQDEISIYDDLVSRFGDADEIELRQQVANALFYKGFILGEQEKWQGPSFQLILYGGQFVHAPETFDMIQKRVQPLIGSETQRLVNL